jgi:hypothetical protein
MVSEPARVTEEELRSLVRLLRRYSETDMDQFENWRFATSFGDVFVQISREPAPGATRDSYSDLDALL